MALVKCPKCGTAIPSTMQKCPKCGAVIGKATSANPSIKNTSAKPTAASTNRTAGQGVQQQRRTTQTGAQIANKQAAQRKAQPQKQIQQTAQAPQQQSTKKKNSALSIVALITAILFITGPVGVLLGVIDLLKKDEEHKHGLAIAAIIVGFFGCVAWANSFLDKFTSKEDNNVAVEENYDYPQNLYTVSNDDYQREIESEESEDKWVKEESKEIPEATYDDNSSEESSEEELKPIYVEDLGTTEGYAFISPEDLSKYYANLEGVRVYLVAEIKNTTEKSLMASTDDSIYYTEFVMRNSSDVSEDFLGHTLAIAGTVDVYDDFWLFGKGINLRDCIIIAADEDAEKYRKSSTDSALNGYLVNTEATANTYGTKDLTEDEYIALCTEYSADDFKKILRNPDQYEKRYIKLSGRVKQTIKGLLGLYYVYIEDSAGNLWEASYMYKDGEDHMLEDDRVTVYGKLNGTTTSSTVLGKQVIMPDIDVKYYSIR